MSAVRPVAVYALKVPTGGVLIPAVPQAAASVSLSSRILNDQVELKLIVLLVPCEHGCH